MILGKPVTGIFWFSEIHIGPEPLRRPLKCREVCVIWTGTGISSPA